MYRTIMMILAVCILILTVGIYSMVDETNKSTKVMVEQTAQAVKVLETGVCD